MLKKLFLRHKSRPKNEAQVAHCTYVDSKSIGILYNRDEYSKEIIEDLSDNLKGDDKEVSLLGFESKPQENSPYFSKKDISNTGVFKKESVQFFVNQSFDFLISLDSSENMNYRFVLALCKSRCKVGIESEEYYELLDMALKKSNTPLESMKSVVKYLKMI
jgi:hypothetical protein